MLNDSKEWHILIAGVTQDPVSQRELNRLLEEGRIGDDALLWKAGFARWISVDEVIHAHPTKAKSELQGNVDFNTNDSKEWHIHFAGVTHAPVSQHELNKLLEEGRIGDDALLWRVGFDRWIPVNEVIGAYPAKARRQWYVLKNDVPVGPFNDSCIRDQIANSEIGPASLVCPSGGDAWQEASKVFSFNSSEGLNWNSLSQRQVGGSTYKRRTLQRNRPALIWAKHVLEGGKGMRYPPLLGFCQCSHLVLWQPFFYLRPLIYLKLVCLASLSEVRPQVN